jgi:hypothetical protein
MTDSLTADCSTPAVELARLLAAAAGSGRSDPVRTARVEWRHACIGTRGMQSGTVRVYAIDSHSRPSMHGDESEGPAACVYLKLVLPTCACFGATHMYLFKRLV